MGVDGCGMGLMLEAGMIASHIGSYVGENKLLGRGTWTRSRFTSWRATLT